MVSYMLIEIFPRLKRESERELFYTLRRDILTLRIMANIYIYENRKEMIYGDLHDSNGFSHAYFYPLRAQHFAA